MRSIKRLLHDAGILIFNHNSHIDYTKIAEQCVKQCRKHIPNIPIMSVGEKIQGVDEHRPIGLPLGNKKVFGVISKEWHNLSRFHAYDISPWQTTIVIDSDYFLQSDQIMKLFESSQSLLMHREWYDINNDDVGVLNVGKSAISMLWATVLKFEKTKEVKKFFSLWQSVIENYTYYAHLFGFTPHIIRNDYAVSIALSQLMDFDSVDHCVIPWPIHTTRDTVDVTAIADNQIHFQDTKGKFIVNFDCHILNKESLYNACR
jgi:hypothetical protein|tara:strand:- start:675 stop:1454 length:780 start_codon:yes stop_codon:yes gene_type:complete